ncbi:MAG: hypothetical protein AAF570_07095, partial [Bacteroidota bacterium]
RGASSKRQLDLDSPAAAEIAADLHAAPLPTARAELAARCKVGPPSECYTPPYLVFAWFSPAYREALLGMRPEYSAGFAPYDGPTVLSRAFGGAQSPDVDAHARYGPSDTAAIALELEILDAVPTEEEAPGDLAALLEFYEVAHGGDLSLAERVTEALIWVKADFAAAAKAGWGVELRYG